MLSPTLARAAAFVLEQPAAVVNMSMREIASASGIQAPNYSRLAKRMGFGNYTALRAVYRRRVESGKPVVDSIPDIGAAAGAEGSAYETAAESLWASFRNTAIANLGAAFENVDSEMIASVADELRSCRRVHVAATHDSHHLGRYLHAIANMCTPSFHVIGRSGAAFGDDLVDIGEGDAVICMSSTSSPQATLQTAQLGRDRGALIVGIVESRTAALATVSDRLLLAPMESPSFFRSQIGAIAIIEMLVAFIELGSGAEGSERIERILADRRRFGQN